MSDLTDRGVHLSPSDLVDVELTEAGWQSQAAHRNSAVWISPADGLIYPTAMALQMARSGVRGDNPIVASFKQEARRAHEEAAKQSTKKGNTHDPTN
jgi:hypothetical protein